MSRRSHQLPRNAQEGQRVSGGTIGENARSRYRVRARLARRGIPVPRTSQLPTNPILAAPAERSADRRISAGFIVEAATGAPDSPPRCLVKRRTTPHARFGVLDNHPVISTIRVLLRGSPRARTWMLAHPPRERNLIPPPHAPRQQQPGVMHPLVVPSPIPVGGGECAALFRSRDVESTGSASP